MSDFDTENITLPICPYCLHEHDLCDIFEDGIYMCEHCDKEFEFEIEMIANCSTYKLNK